MTNFSFIESPSSVSKCALSKEAKDAVPAFALPLRTECSFHSLSEDDESIPTAEPLSEFQTLTSKVHRLLSFEKLENEYVQSETVQACSLSLRTRLPHFLNNTKQQEHLNTCKRQSTLALLRASQYIDRIEQGLTVESTVTLDEQLRTVLAGLDVQNFPENVRNNITFRLSPWVNGFDLPVGALARTVLDVKGTQRPVVVEVEPIVEFRTGDVTSINYATRAARACEVTIKSCRHVGFSIGNQAGIVGEGTIWIHIKPLGIDNMVDERGNALSLRIKEIRL
jgi:hypothetical protein